MRDLRIAATGAKAASLSVIPCLMRMQPREFLGGDYLRAASAGTGISTRTGSEFGAVGVAWPYRRRADQSGSQGEQIPRQAFLLFRCLNKRCNSI
jgi:hypothetical protein